MIRKIKQETRESREHSRECLIFTMRYWIILCDRKLRYSFDSVIRTATESLREVQILGAWMASVVYVHPATPLVLLLSSLAASGR
jgi:hypothetical protein